MTHKNFLNRITKYIFISILSLLLTYFFFMHYVSILIFMTTRSTSQITYLCVEIVLLLFIWTILYRILFKKYPINNQLIYLISGIFYIAVLSFFLFFRNPHYGISYNLIPFKTIMSYIYGPFNLPLKAVNLVGNVFVFVPLGSILYYLNSISMKLNRFLQFILFLSILFGIEIIQVILHVGSFDVDDILLNMVGAYIGVYFLLFYRKKRN